ncbi:nuclease [Alkalicaulis satelles]|uniref:Nuclease n=1 Tax=Alkalicaulis satelles TaxID=2609175 RepID=A0A5M6ZJ40_9PROT|nr:nuclease [Alkalicaulis satelles]KAA5803707.1 nuclease [Alkalicaulis satelles]
MTAQPAVAQALPGPVPAEVLHIVDGDTVGVRAHTWPGQYVEIRVRLRGVDAPEIRRVACEAERVKGHEATGFTRDWLSAPDGEGFAPVMLTEIGPDSFWGRVVARIVREADGADLSEDLMAAGLAVPFRQTGPWCEGEAGEAAR